MNLSELRKRLSPSNLIQKSAPVLLGATLLVSASCSNVREFAGLSRSERAQTQGIAQESKVEHAYTASNTDGDFVKLLEHKMQQPSGKKQAPKSPQVAETPAQPSVQELLAAGKDPFIDSTPPTITPKRTKTEPPRTRVLDLASLSDPAPSPNAIVEKSNPDFAQPANLLEENLAPRPFIDTELQLVAANESQQQAAELPIEVTPLAEATATTVQSEELPEDQQSVGTLVFPDFEEKVVSEVAPAAMPKQAVVVAEADPVEQSESNVPQLEQPQVEIAEVVAPPMPVAELFEELEVKTEIEQPESLIGETVAFNNETNTSLDAAVCPAPAVCPPPVAAAPQIPYPSPYYAQSTMYPAPEISGDEYIHDGGDAGTKVYYNDFSRFGLDAEDTIAEYDDDVGVAHVKASTRATVYAPRFAAVRTATLPYTDVKIVKLAGHQDRRFLAGIETKLLVDEKTHNDEALGMRLRARPSGVEGNAVDTSVHQNITVGRHVKLLNVYEEIRFFKEGQLSRLNTAVIGNSIAAALDWNGDLGVNIYAHDIGGQVVQARITAQDYTVVEDRSTPGDLTIVKVVDKKVAKPGEVLTFTIRFDNTGDRPLRNIRVVDNLSPRLVYIEGSVDSDLNGKLDTESNGQGSDILSFSFEEELKGHTGGWVSFKCRVR